MYLAQTKTGANDRSDTLGTKKVIFSSDVLINTELLARTNFTIHIQNLGTQIAIQLHSHTS
jgi:hypothetical protein